MALGGRGLWYSTDQPLENFAADEAIVRLTLRGAGVRTKTCPLFLQSVYRSTWQSGIALKLVPGAFCSTKVGEVAASLMLPRAGCEPKLVRFSFMTVIMLLCHATPSRAKPTVYSALASSFQCVGQRPSFFPNGRRPSRYLCPGRDLRSLLAQRSVRRSLCAG